MYLNVTDDLNKFEDNSYYAIVDDDGEVGGVSLGSYIKRNVEWFEGRQLTYVPNEQAESIMWNL